MDLRFECVSPDNLTKSYRGVAGHCRCGCKGTYRYMKRATTPGAPGYPGYDVSEDVSEAAAKRTLKELQFQHGLFPIDMEPCGSIKGEWFADAQIGGRDVTVYFTLPEA